jgi:hypothetical protein
MKTDLSIKAAIYLRAAELVEQGHCKNAVVIDALGMELRDVMSEEAVAWCVIGALERARRESGAEQSFFMAFQKALGMDAIDWNNAPDTTAAMVAAKLREQAFA